MEGGHVPGLRDGGQVHHLVFLQKRPAEGLVNTASFADLCLHINGAEIAYGNFIQAVLNFLIMAFVVFCLVKTVNRLSRKKEEVPPPQTPRQGWTGPPHSPLPASPPAASSRASPPSIFSSTEKRVQSNHHIKGDMV